MVHVQGRRASKRWVGVALRRLNAQQQPRYSSRFSLTTQEQAATGMGSSAFVGTAYHSPGAAAVAHDRALLALFGPALGGRTLNFPLGTYPPEEQQRRSGGRR